MKVLEFDTSRGVYAFQFEELETAFHKHPAIEVLIADEQSISLTTENEVHENLSMAIIDSNIKHKVSCSAGSVRAIMIEHRDVAVKEKLASQSIDLVDGLFLSKQGADIPFDVEELYQDLLAVENRSGYDERISKVIHYLYQHDLAYETMMEKLTALASLSESRLSHLFKENVGMSLKKYLLWCKLRATISQFLDQKENLFSALIQSGFYDQPHFSRAFKTMLGVQPSKAYNSRTVQS